MYPDLTFAMRICKICERRRGDPLTEKIFYSSERIICLAISDLSCGNSISAKLGIHVSSLYSAVPEHLRAITSQLHSTSGNVQKHSSASAWTAQV